MNLQEKKTDLIKCIQEFLCLVERLQEEKKKIDQNNQMARRFLPAFFQYNFQNITEGLKIHQKVVDRENIKCVFVGKTSNGKSAVINSLLGENIFESNPGKTTSCFISIKGCVEDVGYILDENGKKSGYDLLKRTNIVKEKHYTADTILEFFYPEQKCPLLEKKVELLDCPGIGAIEDYEIFIAKNSEDADIFVLVLDCNSELTKTERKFFEDIKLKFSKVNVTVLINKWDQMPTDDKSIFDGIKLQMERSVGDFLKEISNPYLNSMYFGSATTALNTEDQSLQTFKQFLLNASESPFEIKIVSRIMSMKEDISAIDELTINKRRDVSRNISDSRMDSLVASYFKNFDSQAKIEIKKGNEEMLKQWRKSERPNRETDQGLQIFEEFLTHLGEIYSQQNEELWNKIEDSLKEENIQFDSKTAKVDFFELYNLKEIQVEYKKSMKSKCKRLQKDINNRLLEIESMPSNSFIGAIQKLFGMKTEQEKKYENTLLYFQNLYETQSADVTKKLEQSFNAHRKQTRHIQSIFDEERGKLVRILTKLMDLFPVKI